MKLFLPFEPLAKSDTDECIVEGYASTEALDSQGEVVKREALERALPDFMKFGNIREMHDPRSAAGVALKAEHDDKGLRISAHVVDPVARKKVEAGVYKGFSIGGKVTNRDRLNKSIITGIHLIEISLVDRPANPEALFDAWKADGADEPMTKGMTAVSILANITEDVSRLLEHSKIEETQEGDTASVVPGKLTDALAQLTQTLEAMVAEETAELLDGTDAEMPCAPEMIFMAEGTMDIEKRAYTPAERKMMASTKEALPDGSFPIKNRADLENAIKAYGRAKDKAAAKAHIEDRAKALGAEDLIPDGWTEKADEPFDLEKKGRRNSSADQKKLDDAHDAIVAAGAHCENAMKGEGAGDLAKVGADLAKAQDDLTKAGSDLADAQDKLSKAETDRASAQTALDAMTRSRDGSEASLSALGKSLETVTTERTDLAKRNETLVADLAAITAKADALKAEVDALKSAPEPMKGKLLAVGRGEEVTAAQKSAAQSTPEVEIPEKWFTTRPA